MSVPYNLNYFSFSSKLHAGLLLLLVLLFTSCEKVIDIDLNDAEKKYVIEANLSNQPNSCQVFISSTKDFNESNRPVGITNAVVTITENNGAPLPLAATSAGLYERPSLAGTPGHTYQLNVTIGNKVFTALCTMPQQVTFDSLYFTERTFFNETNKYATVRYKDPAGEKNAYRFIQYVNGVKEKTLFVRDDDANNGLSIERPLIYFFEEDEKDEKALKSGDNIRVEMLSISYPVYKYWNSLSEGATGDNQSTSPGNPLTNLQGGALGYFSAHSIQAKTMIVP